MNDTAMFIIDSAKNANSKLNTNIAEIMKAAITDGKENRNEKRR